MHSGVARAWTDLLPPTHTPGTVSALPSADSSQRVMPTAAGPHQQSMLGDWPGSPTSTRVGVGHNCQQCRVQRGPPPSILMVILRRILETKVWAELMGGADAPPPTCLPWGSAWPTLQVPGVSGPCGHEAVSACVAAVHRWVVLLTDSPHSHFGEGSAGGGTCRDGTEAGQRAQVGA